MAESPSSDRLEAATVGGIEPMTRCLKSGYAVAGLPFASYGNSTGRARFNREASRRWGCVGGTPNAGPIVCRAVDSRDG